MIRPLEKADLPSVARLERQCFSAPWSLEDIEQEMDLNPFFYGFVQEEGIVISYALFDLIFEDGHLSRIGTDPQFQNRGLGFKMLKAVLGKAKDSGCEQFLLEVRVSNTPARALYEKAGLSVFRKMERYYQDGEDALGMRIDFKNELSDEVERKSGS